MERWKEYGAELFERPDGELPMTENRLPPNEQEPPPLLSEVENAMKKLSSGKSPELDGIPAEMVKATGPYGVKMLHRLCLSIWETCHWPEDWKIQEFVVLFNPKRAGGGAESAPLQHFLLYLCRLLFFRAETS